MVCYGPRITTLAIVGAVVYVFFHRLIAHILHIAGLIFEITLITCAGAAAVALLIWTTRRIQRRRATAGACTQCRYRCQQALTQPGLARPALAPHRHLPVVQIIRRQAPPSGATALLAQPTAAATQPTAAAARPAAAAARRTAGTARPGPWPAAVPLPAAISLAASAAGPATPAPAPAGAGRGYDDHAPGGAADTHPQRAAVRHDDYLLTPV